MPGSFQSSHSLPGTNRVQKQTTENGYTFFAEHMPIKKLIKDQFVYIAFRKGDISEMNEFKRELAHVLKQDERDIVIDLSQETKISEAEVALLAGIIRQLQGSPRTLRIITTFASYTRLANHNLDKAENIQLYKNHDQLLQGLNQVAVPEEKGDGR
jgi:anti-anti-sigma regulatory factor